MEWNVYVYNINARRIEQYNIFEHYKILEYCKKALKKYRDDKEQFIEQVRRELMYYFWGKVEWEITIDEYPSYHGDTAKKVDVYEQVKLNWDVFADYIWNHREKLKRTKC